MCLMADNACVNSMLLLAMKPLTAAICFKLSRYLNILITRNTRNDLSTRRLRMDLQFQHIHNLVAKPM